MTEENGIPVYDLDIIRYTHTHTHTHTHRVPGKARPRYIYIYHLRPGGEEEEDTVLICATLLLIYFAQHVRLRPLAYLSTRLSATDFC
jgi:hypothetical protein